MPHIIKCATYLASVDSGATTSVDTLESSDAFISNSTIEPSISSATGAATEDSMVGAID